MDPGTIEIVDSKISRVKRYVDFVDFSGVVSTVGRVNIDIYVRKRVFLGDFPPTLGRDR